MSGRTPVIVTAAWLGIGLANVGVTNGASRDRWPDLMQDTQEARDAFTFALVWSTVGGPVGAVVMLLETHWQGTYTWSSAPLPCRTQYPKIWCRGNMPGGPR